MNHSRILAGALGLAMSAGAVQAQSFTEAFDDMLILPTMDWFYFNNSDEPAVGYDGWIQGIDDPRITAHMGAGTAYAGANYQATSGPAGTETISTWMLLPQRQLKNGDTLKFWTRCVTPLTTIYPDRMQVRMSTAGASTNVGTLPFDVGDFTTLLIDINPTYSQQQPTNNPPTNGYPDTYTQYTLTVSGLPSGGMSGRFAFRYFVENAGLNGINSNFIGVDTLEYTAATGPAPCYANCDGSSIAPILNVADFICFQTSYAAGSSYANCDGSTVAPVLNVADFICFQTKYAAGCS